MTLRNKDPGEPHPTARPTRATPRKMPSSESNRARPFTVPDRRSLLLSPSSYQANLPNTDLPNGLLSASESQSTLDAAASVAASAPSLIDRSTHVDDAPLRNVYLFTPPTVISSPRASHWTFTMDNMNVTELIERLGSDEDAVRKMAVFKLQSNVGDPSFAELFISEGGLSKLKYLIMRASGNTLAYSLASFSRLLEVDKGWECVEQDMIQRVCDRVIAALQPVLTLSRSLSLLSRILWSTSYEELWESSFQSCPDPTILPAPSRPTNLDSKLSSQQFQYIRNFSRCLSAGFPLLIMRSAPTLCN